MGTEQQARSARPTRGLHPTASQTPPLRRDVTACDWKRHNRSDRAERLARALSRERRVGVAVELADQPPAVLMAELECDHVRR